METEVQTLLDSFADLREKANVNVAFGEPVTVEGRTVIPVAKVAYAFRMGVERGTMAEEETAEGTADSGGGGGMLARPLAVVEVTPEGAWVKPIIDEQKLALAGALLAGWIVICLARTLVRIFGRDGT